MSSTMTTTATAAATSSSNSYLLASTSMDLNYRQAKLCPLLEAMLVDKDEGVLGVLRFMADLDKQFYCQMKQDACLQDHIEQYMDGRIPSPDLSGNDSLSSYIVMAKHFIRNRASFPFLHFDVGASLLSQSIDNCKDRCNTLVLLIKDLNRSLLFLRPFACDHSDMKSLEEKVQLRLQRAGVPVVTNEATYTTKEPTSVPAWPPEE